MFRYNKKFDAEFEYQGNDLGAVCEGSTTSFRIWAPFALCVELYLYEEGTAGMALPQDSVPESGTKYLMEEQEKKVFSLKFDQNLHGTFYDFLIHTEDGTIRTADPYAVGCCANGCRSAVVDLSRTNPKGFEQDCPPEKQNETIIYELHVKDFSHDENSGVPKDLRGKFKAFTIPSVGMDHMKELGVTHIHLLPFYDFGSVDELGSTEQFNWGYDPLNYNVPEGSFATDPSDPVVRIRECKEMIRALHREGFRVIMDVVYNHTYTADSWMERTAQGYYNRMLPDGTLANGSGCGSDVAAGRAMVDNYIVNSVLYWAREYHLDGFRFDLMGLLTTDLMNRIRRELDEIYGENEKLLYGEPWSADDSPMEEGTCGALKENVQLLDKNIAVFCDATRDVIKGDVFHKDWPGFINGGAGMEQDVLRSVEGWIEGKEGFTPVSSSQIINYVSAHDNFTLWDKLVFTSAHEDYTTPYPDLIAQNKLAAFIYFTCQGHIFLQAGEEMARTKLGEENSFRSSPEINMIRWENAKTYKDLLDYYKGLIRLRKSIPALYEKRDDKTFDRKTEGNGIVSFTVSTPKDPKTGAKSKVFVVYNSSDRDLKITLPDGNWEIVVNDESSDIRQPAGKTAAVKKHSGLMCEAI